MDMLQEQVNIEKTKTNDDKKCVDLTSKSFYSNAAKYWENIPATVDGMLGGFGFISHTDIDGSQNFLSSLYELENPPGRTYALDCGSGIGRITKNLLVKHFDKVDLVEQNSSFLQIAKESLSSYPNTATEFYPSGLQDFIPESEKYDVIWCQWVLGHLPDDDLIEFFKKCTKGLRKNGVIVVKENITSSNKLEVDTEDSSITRPYHDFKRIFEKAELCCIKEKPQSHMPRGLYPIVMFALRAANPPQSLSETS